MITQSYETSAGGLEVKGSIVRGYATALRTLGYYDRVSPQLSASTRALLEAPPAATAWVGFAWNEELVALVEAEFGLPAVRRLGREAVMSGVAPLSRGMLEGMLRLFGVSPATIFARIGVFAQLTTRGMSYEYTATSPTSGQLTVTIAKPTRVAPAAWESTAGSLEPTFEACHVIGTVAQAVVRPGIGNVGDYALRWQRKS